MQCKGDATGEIQYNLIVIQGSLDACLVLVAVPTGAIARHVLGDLGGH